MLKIPSHMHRIRNYSKNQMNKKKSLASEALQTSNAADFRFLLQNFQDSTRGLGHENFELVLSFAGSFHEENPVDTGIAGALLSDGRNAVQNHILASRCSLVDVADISLLTFVAGVFQFFCRRKKHFFLFSNILIKLSFGFSSVDFNIKVIVKN